jgi:hypothetical protein
MPSMSAADSSVDDSGTAAIATVSMPVPLEELKL